ncbi:putative cupin domain-containing protein [Botrytis fragariae]|uniref:CENP-C homolog n=1 Tax=Botrytis fragariae TaxID=1964551 RepID=A0A8H6AYS8_9HELO|nr:putative cupin domain-containing protein [Botrytis fragariae]KAF5876103.1 putative cupin domain-containing protein [Botrytis fragariae]
MAPEQSASPPGRRRTGANRENQYLFNLGVKGRKTGVELPDTGIRDANGLEPMDDLFSPDKPESVKTARSANGPRRNALEDATISSEEDMDMDGENTAPEPTEVLNQRRQDARLALPIPRSRSPLKTHLQSPARRHPSFGISSPAKEASSEADNTGPVRRKLDFSAEDIAVETKQATSAPNERGKPGRPALGNLTNGTRLSPGRRPPQTLNQSSDGMENQDESALEFEDDSNQYNAPDDEDDDAAVDALEGNSDLVEEYEEQEEEAEIEQEDEPEPEPSPPRKVASKNKGKGKGKGKVVEEPEPEEVPELEQPAPKRRGRKPKNSAPQIEPVEEERKEIKERPTKKARRSAEAVEAPQPTRKNPGKSGRPSNASKSTTVPKAAAKPKGRSKMAPVSEVDSPLVHRGPPIPRKNGLYILRRETALGGTGMLRTRSGRNSMKPLAFWKGEHVEYDDDGTVPDGTHGAKILLPSIKEVVRVDEVEQEKRSRPKYQKSSKRKSKKRAREELDEDSETEEWESQPGRIEGSVRIWDPEDQVGENAAEKVEDVAFSSAAIKTRDIPNASFKFAKTLTLPFFGSGMVDLEPGAVKKPKNSRKMQMVFFVFYGRVEVSVNETTFRIGKGGQWQVPRGNFYSITNDYDKPARIFFAQGCELEDSEGGAAPPASQ